MNKEQLIARMKDLMNKQQAILDKAKAEDNRTLLEEEVTSFENYQKEIENLEKQVEIAEKMELNNKFMNAPQNTPVIPVDNSVQNPQLDDGGFKNIGELLNAVKFGDSKGRLQNLSTGDVGILIPPAFSQEILSLNPEKEIVMPRATNIPAGNPPDAPFTIPYFQQGDNGALGGIELIWTAEGKPVADVNDPKIKDLTLEPQEVSGMATINNKTLKNWEASGTYMQNLLRQAWISGRDYKFLRGLGVGTPLGILKAPGAIKHKRNTSATIKYDDAAQMLGRLLPEAMDEAIWTASISALPTIIQLTDGNGRLIFVQGDATKGIPSTLLGLPIKFTGKTPTMGNEGDLVLADFNYYLTKAGSGPYIAISEHVKFTTNKTVFKIVANIDGQPWVKDPLKLENGQTTVSPYVILK